MMKPENGVPKNLDYAFSGRFTDSDVMKASDAIEELIRTPKPYRPCITGAEELDDGSLNYHECDECRKNKECRERYERAKSDKDALTKFFKKDRAELDAQEVADLRDVARIFCYAWLDRDSGFFEEMAKLMKAFSGKEKVIPRISVCDRTILTTSPYHAAVLMTYMTWHINRQSDKGNKEIGYEEFLQAVNDKFPMGIDDRTFQRIIKAVGIKLKRGKPGPKPERKKTSGQTRE